ncbi:MAG: hypothetical protein QM820_40535 [Minicystis sp.]
MIDYPDRSARTYVNYNYVEGFNDKASAARYCIPPGWRYRLYEHSNFQGSYRDLVGTGSLNLNNVGFGDRTSSSEWLHF